jgi:hypothetical protein
LLSEKCEYRKKKKRIILERYEMKKLILVLAIALMASPVFALSVNLTREGTTNVIDLTYSDACSTNLPRAFALDLTFPTGAQFSSVVSGSYMTGESNQPNHRGYGIYPARISLDTAGVVQNWGTPLADSNVSSPADPGAGAALPSSHMVLEFASLYYDNPAATDTNAPPTSGTLCKFTVNPGAVSNPPIIMSDEITYRGGLVLENGTQDLTAADKTFIYTTLAAPGKATGPNHNGDTGVARIGTSLTWTAGTGTVDSHDVYFGTVSPGIYIGNQAGTSYAIPGTMAQGKVYYWRIDEKNTVGTTTGDIWSFRVEECMKSTATEYNRWVTYGRPDCWCYRKQCRGDADGKLSSLKPVMASDLTILKGGYNKAGSVVRDLVVTGYPAICADFDRKDSSLKPVMASDLTILKAYYNKANTVVPQCDTAPVVGLYNFWMN